MALDLGLTTYQLLSALDGVAPNIQSRRRRLDDAIDRALAVHRRRGGLPHRRGGTPSLPLRPHRPRGPAGQPAAAPGSPGLDRAVRGRLPHRRGPPPAPPLPPRNLGGCAITYGQNHGCQLFSEPTLAVDDADLYLRAPNGTSGETLIAGPLLGALRTVREVERLADAVENLPDDRPVLALLDGTLAFWDLQRGNYPRYVAHVLIAERLQPALARLRAASTNRRPVAVAAYTSRPRTTEVAGALGLMLCEQADADCNRLCTARHSDLTSCDGAAGFKRPRTGPGLSGGHLRGPRAGRHHRPGPGGVPPPDPHALGTAVACPLRSPPRPHPSVGPGSEPIVPSDRPPTVVRFQLRRSASPADVTPEAAALECQEDRR